MIIDLSTPTTVRFGRGRLAELGAVTAERGRDALLVCGRTSARRHGHLDAALSSLADAGVRVTVFDDVSPDPRAHEIDAAVAQAQAAGCDVVIGLGGGSALDAAKAVAVSLRHGPCGPLVGRTLERIADPVPVIAVPTTAGSGAEVTKGAIVTDTDRSLKAGIRGDDLFPAVALIDPALLRSVPARVAAESGFDALAHAVEGYVARRANAITRHHAEWALGLLGHRLPQAVAGDLSDEVLDDMALAALLGGLNVANASTCLPHRVQQAMGAVPRVRISHGRGLAAVYPAWLELTYAHAPGSFDRIGELLGGPDVGLALGRIMEDTGVREGLGAHGFAPGDLETVAGSVVGNTANDPNPSVDDTTVKAILEHSMT
ncbi:iron-containing alcohol dehydrogenase [Streptomyces roseifaciens]